MMGARFFESTFFVLPLWLLLSQLQPSLSIQQPVVEIQAPIETPNVQVPPASAALNDLRGSDPISAVEQHRMLNSAIPDVDYPILTAVPDNVDFSCDNKYSGYYADTSHRCQVFHRCDVNGDLTSFLCPKKTVFNQITLVCDWFFNVRCANSVKYYGYSNPRIGHPGWVLLDDFKSDFESACECTREFRPVCGKDGKTYNNACLARCAGVNIVKNGSCDSSCFCTQQYNPVCGKDGKTYGNACMAHCAGVDVVSQGECPCICTEEFAPVCGEDGMTYSNACFAGCAGTQVVSQGQCDGQPLKGTTTR